MKNRGGNLKKLIHLINCTLNYFPCATHYRLMSLVKCRHRLMRVFKGRRLFGACSLITGLFNKNQSAIKHVFLPPKCDGFITRLHSLLTGTRTNNWPPIVFVAPLLLKLRQELCKHLFFPVRLALLSLIIMLISALLHNT